MILYYIAHSAEDLVVKNHGRPLEAIPEARYIILCYSIYYTIILCHMHVICIL